MYSLPSYKTFSTIKGWVCSRSLNHSHFHTKKTTVSKLTEFQLLKCLQVVLKWVNMFSDKESFFKLMPQTNITANVLLNCMPDNKGPHCKTCSAESPNQPWCQHADRGNDELETWFVCCDRILYARRQAKGQSSPTSHDQTGQKCASPPPSSLVEKFHPERAHLLN